MQMEQVFEYLVQDMPVCSQFYSSTFESTYYCAHTFYARDQDLKSRTTNWINITISIRNKSKEVLLIRITKLIEVPLTLFALFNCPDAATEINTTLPHADNAWNVLSIIIFI